jgi:RNA polymerase sigma-70 factor (ECF subfamily)
MVLQETLPIGVTAFDQSRRAAADRDAMEVARAAKGDAQAFERLYRTHVARVHSLVRRMAGGTRGAAGSHDVEALAQDVFVRAWQKLATFRGESAFGTWLHRLAVNVVLERFRVGGIERARRVDWDGVFETARSTPARPDLSIDFDAALERLPDGAREIFVLHDVEGYTHREIATLLGISPGTSKAQLHRARMMLRKYLT